MRTGVSYLGHHNPRHMESDIKDIKKLGCDDIFLAAQENDFVYMRGKIDFFPDLAAQNRIRPLIIFWGVLNCFGGGRSSQFLLNNPQCRQRKRDHSYLPWGCYNNPAAAAYIKELIDRAAKAGFAGYFIDEPTLLDCYCSSCEKDFKRSYGGALRKADKEKNLEFRNNCAVNYIRNISAYIKKNHPKMETLCCIMPQDRLLWQETARLKCLDTLGTDIYWVNDDIAVEKMRPIIREMAQVCAANDKKHHQWLQCWGVKKGREKRIKEQGKIILEEKPDSLYVWAYQGQIGISESCQDPATSWKAACEIIKKAVLL